MQCRADADCEANPNFHGRVCELGFCAIKKPDPGPGSTGGEGCVSTALCTQANSGKASVCAKAGTPCVPWEDAECPTITGQWDNPDAIMVGALLPLTFDSPLGSSTPAYATRLQRAIDLAAGEFDRKIPGLKVGSKTRPIALLHCNSRGIPNQARNRFTHLTDVVGAQAVIVGWDDDLAAVAPLATERKTAIVCSDCLAPLPAGLDARRIIPPITLDAPLAAWRVKDLEAKIKQVDPSPIRVALLIEGLRVPKAFSDELLKTLEFNGTSAAGNGSNFLPVMTEDPREHTIDHDGHAAAIAAFAPHVIVVGMASAFPTFFIPLIEKKWPADKPRPYYIVTQLNYEVASFEDALTSDELRRRVSGTYPRLDDSLRANVESYETRYRQEFFSAADGNFSGYESFYATAFAAAAAASADPFAPIDGPRIAAGFERLSNGPSVDFHPGQINAGISLLGAGSIDVRGLTSELDWNPTTRELETEMAMYCFGRDESGLVLKSDPGGVFYSPKTGLITGTYACE